MNPGFYAVIALAAGYFFFGTVLLVGLLKIGKDDTLPPPKDSSGRRGSSGAGSGSWQDGWGDGRRRGRDRA